MNYITGVTPSSSNDKAIFVLADAEQLMLPQFEVFLPGDKVAIVKLSDLQALLADRA